MEFPLESIDDLEEFVDRVFQKTYGEMTFWFAFLDMAFHYFRDDVISHSYFEKNHRRK